MVVASDRIQPLAVLGEDRADDVLAVPGVRPSLVLRVHDRVVEDINQAVVVASRYERLVAAHVDAVHVRAVLAERMNAADVPAELDRTGGPDEVLGVVRAVRVVNLVSNVEVELLVVATRRSYIAAVLGPVQRLNVRAMF